MNEVSYTEIDGLPEPTRGKVRDIYDLGDKLLLVATDRLSAFDVVLPDPIPDKGKVLTQISKFWLNILSPAEPHHLISSEWEGIEEALNEKNLLGIVYKEILDGRTMLVKKSNPYKVECVVRGYLAGSLWKDYVKAGGESNNVVINGIEFPAGLKLSDKLPEPIFTPSTKADTGHDENISIETARTIIGDAIDELARRSIALYLEASDFAAQRGIILADTKFEFGELDGECLLIDEVLTPDSSRFWDAETYNPGESQPSFDKQYVRDYLEAINWNKQPPAPYLSSAVVEQTANRYREAYLRLTGGNI